jgi:hypothetical protein
MRFCNAADPELESTRPIISHVSSKSSYLLPV